jgi:DNA repair protein RadC
VPKKEEEMKRYKPYPLELIKVSEAISDKPLCSPKAVCDYMQDVAVCDREIFWVIYVNTKNKVVRREMAAMGGISSCRVDPGIVLRGAVAYGVPSIITCHNHPTFHCYPSAEDKQLWETMNQACRILGITLLDHMIIGKGSYYSYEENK